MASWLEAWNRFICCHLSYYPATVLKMAKYQSNMTTLFTNHPPAHCLEYDCLFRQAASRDTSIRWDVIKEDIYVWSVTKRSTAFRDRFSIMSRLGPAVLSSDKIERKLAHKMERRSAKDTTLDAAPWETNAAMPIAAGSRAASSRTQGSGALSSGPQRGHTTLRHSEFERELVSHPDKAWFHGCSAL